MAEAEVSQRLAAILAADAAGYSRLMQDDERATVAALDESRVVFRRHIEANRGRVVDMAGDSVLAVFATAAGAVAAALAVQSDLGALNEERPEARRMRFRLGVHLGDVIEKGDGSVYGDGVNIAARLESIAEPGGIAVSDMVQGAVKGRLEVGFEFLGERAVKNIAEPLRAYHIGGAAARPQPRPDLPAKPSIAVLPFDNMSGDPEQEYFSDGIAEDLITALSRIRWLLVIARNSTFAYKGQATDVKRVGRELSVAYMLEGSVRKAGARVRISAQLVDTASGAHLWARRYDRDIDDIFAVQDEITETIASAIEPEISVMERERARRKPPESLGAWDLYQRGLWHMYQFDKNANAEARRLFEKAIDLDPDFGAAYSGLAYTHFTDVSLAFRTTRDESLRNAMAAARKAVALDDKDAFAHCVLGRVYTIPGDNDSAIAELEAAIALNPSFAMAHYALGMALTMAGQPERAIPELALAVRLNPHDPLLWLNEMITASAYIGLGEPHRALDYARRAVRHPTAGFWAYAVLGCALGHLGDQAEARAAVDKLLELKPDFSPRLFRDTWPGWYAEHFERYLEGLRKAGLVVPDEPAPTA